jgi:PKD repeat protein
MYNYMPDQYPATTWTAARNGVGNDYSSTTNYIYSLYFTGTSSNTYLAMMRPYVTWDTSSIPDTAIITAAKVTLYGYGRDSLGTPDASIIDCYPSNPVSGTVTDYSKTTFTRQAADIPYSSFSTSGMNNWTLTNFTGINKAGYTTYMFDTSRGVDNLPPTWAASSQGGFLYNSLTSSSGTKKPFITISYTLPGEETAPVTGFAANPTSGTSPLSVQFTDSSTNTPTDWDWYWYANETKSSDLQHPATTFTTGTYSVRLYTSNSGGGSWQNRTA